MAMVVTFGLCDARFNFYFIYKICFIMFGVSRLDSILHFIPFTVTPYCPSLVRSITYRTLVGLILAAGTVYLSEHACSIAVEKYDVRSCWTAPRSVLKRRYYPSGIS